MNKVIPIIITLLFYLTYFKQIKTGEKLTQFIKKKTTATFKTQLTYLKMFYRTMPSDTIRYKVQKSSELSDNYIKIVISEFIVIKKQK